MRVQLTEARAEAEAEAEAQGQRRGQEIASIDQRASGGDSGEDFHQRKFEANNTRGPTLRLAASERQNVGQPGRAPAGGGDSGEVSRATRTSNIRGEKIMGERSECAGERAARLASRASDSRAGPGLVRRPAQRRTAACGQSTTRNVGDIPRSQPEAASATPGAVMAPSPRLRLTPDSHHPDRRDHHPARHNGHDRRLQDHHHDDDHHHHHHHQPLLHHNHQDQPRHHDQSDRNDHLPACRGGRRGWRNFGDPASADSPVLALVALAIICLLVASFVPVPAQAVDCFKCSSRNGSNPACEDPFHNLNTTRVNSPILPEHQPAVIYHTPCYAGKKGREGLFPASACIKLTGVFDTTGETLVVRHCALDSGTLTQDTELARMSHCGKFQFEGDLLRGCVLACPEDACNSARSLVGLATGPRWLAFLSLAFVLASLAASSRPG